MKTSISVLVILRKKKVEAGICPGRRNAVRVEVSVAVITGH